MLGSMYAVVVMYIGFGILAYGIAYFLVHEVFIHQRFKWFRNSDNVYFRAIRETHKVHHKHMGKEQGVFWYVNCTLEILKTRVEKKQMLKFDFK
jgi:beta-carotene 3-hydroxylase